MNEVVKEKNDCVSRLQEANPAGVSSVKHPRNATCTRRVNHYWYTFMYVFIVL